MSLHSVCVFCGSRPGRNPAHAEAARATGAMLARNGWRLVYGAGDVGLMGEVAKAAAGAGAPMLGVIPVHLLGRERGGSERGGRDTSGFVITEDMHERKKVMFMNSDAVVVLPGGAGSLDEFFEVLTWAQIGLHRKPIFLMSVDGYWQPLLGLIDHVVTEGFADPSVRGLYRLVANAVELEAALQASFAVEIGN